VAAYAAVFAAILVAAGIAGAAGPIADFDAFDIMAGDMEASTVAFRETSLQFPRSHLRPDSAAYSVEARIAPSFIALRSTDGLVPGAMMLAVTPKVLLRRSDGLESNPVRTPGYMPSVTVFYAPRDVTKIGIPGEAAPAFSYFSANLMHHSNGQTGAFLTPEGRPNHLDGSFSLWSASLTAHLHGGLPLLPDYKALSVERLYLKEGSLDAFYPDWIVSLALGTAPRRPGPVPGRVRLLADFDWTPRKSNGIPNSLKPAPYSAALTAAWYPMTAGRGTRLDFAVFARAYAGCDDYNINFDREVYRAELGLMFGPTPFGPVPLISAASNP
jgi:hypothetical protein